jgi:outer membrane protein assembly factor BamB
MALVAGERSGHAFKLSTGELAWSTQLDLNPVLGPALGPKGVVFVALEQGEVDRVEANAILSKVKFEGVITSVLGDERWLLLGMDQGAVIALDSAGNSMRFQIAVAEKRPVTWLACANDLVLYGDQAMLYCVDGAGKENWRHPVENAPPALPDDRTVYQGGTAGLNAFVR